MSVGASIITGYAQTMAKTIILGNLTEVLLEVRANRVPNSWSAVIDQLCRHDFTTAMSHQGLAFLGRYPDLNQHEKESVLGEFMQKIEETVNWYLAWLGTKDVADPANANAEDLLK